MEYLVGESLADLLEREGRLPVAARRRPGRAGLPRRRGRARRRDRPSRSEAAQPVRRPPRRRHRSAEGPRLRRREAAGARRGDRGDAARERSSARPRTCRPSRRAARRPSTSGPTSTRWARSCSRCCPRRCPTRATRRTRSCITSRPSRRCRSSRCEPDLPAELVAIVEPRPDLRPRGPARRPRGRWRGSWRRSRAARSGRRRPRRRRPTRRRSRRRRWRRPRRRRPAERGAESKSSTFNDRRGTPAPPPRRASRAARVALGGAVLVAAAIAVGIGLKSKSVAPRSEARPASPLAETTRFFVPPANPATTQQIARLAAEHALEEASLLTAMTATPRALYFDGGTPEEVEAARPQSRGAGGGRRGSSRPRREQPAVSGLLPVLGRGRARRGRLPRVARRIRSRHR